MAIEWGAWEYSGGNGMRVGIDVDWSTVTNTSTTVTATVKVYTDNQYTYSDSQTINCGGAIDGNVSFTNNDGTSAVLRATKTYTYTYSTYGSSPGSRNFSAALSRAYNGVTPSKTRTDDIPARPYAAPSAPSSVLMTRVSDASTKVTWVDNNTTGKPYTSLTVQRSVNGAAYATVSSPTGAATSYTDASVVPNTRYRYQVRANNSIGSSSFVASAAYIWTTPSVPTINTTLTAVTGPPAGQTITWTNTCGFPSTSEFSTEIIAYKNGVSQGVVGTVGGASSSTFTHLTTNSIPYTTTDRWKYTVRHRTASGTALYSAESDFTTETGGVASTPNPPSGLSPAGGMIVDPTVNQTLTWTHNPTDGSAQTQFQVRHRVVGAGSWTTASVVTSSVSSWTLPANTYASGTSVEWQVCTKGAAASFSSFSSSAVFYAFVTKRLRAYLDLGSGQVVGDLTNYLADVPLTTLATSIKYQVKDRWVWIWVDGSFTTVSGTTLTLGTNIIPAAHRPAGNVRSGGYFGGFPGEISVDVNGTLSAVQQTGANRASISGFLLYPI